MTVIPRSVYFAEIFKEMPEAATVNSYTTKVEATELYVGYPDDFFNNYTLTFTSGVNAGVSRAVSDFSNDVYSPEEGIWYRIGVLTLSSELPSAYTAGDKFIVRRSFHTITSGGAEKLSFLSVKPGITNTIGSFEMRCPDISGSLGLPGNYRDVDLFNDIRIWIDYDTINTGSLAPVFCGKIESIISELNINSGYERTFIGSDYGECFNRILVNQSFKNVSGDTIIQGLRNLCTGSTTGNLSGSNDSLAGDSNIYSVSGENQSVLTVLQDYLNQAVMDTAIDYNKVLHMGHRQITTGSHAFSLGDNLFSYTVNRDIESVKNDIWVFGLRDPSSISGSDFPTSHDYWTELDKTGWEVWLSGSSVSTSGSVYTNHDGMLNQIPAATGSSCILGDLVTTGIGGSTYFYYLTKTLTKTIAVSGDSVLHFYIGSYCTADRDTPMWVKVMSTDDDYYFCRVDDQNTSGIVGAFHWSEYNINLGASNEGISTPGVKNTNTGSYYWQRIGNPDWSNINKVSLGSTVIQNIGEFIFGVDGLYFGIPFQAHVKDQESINTYGLRKHIVSSDTYNSDEYCTNMALTLSGSLVSPPIQVSCTTSGSPGLSLGVMYPVVIPTENLDDYMELIDLEHCIDGGDGFTSKCILSNKKELKTIVPVLQYPFVTTEYITVWDAIQGMIRNSALKVMPLSRV